VTEPASGPLDNLGPAMLLSGPKLDFDQALPPYDHVVERAVTGARLAVLTVVALVPDSPLLLDSASDRRNLVRGGDQGRQPPMSSICESLIEGKRFSFEMICGIRLSRCPTTTCPDSWPTQFLTPGVTRARGYVCSPLQASDASIASKAASWSWLSP
jgi:hypothetical protein